jgi:hypothetical protein
MTTAKRRPPATKLRLDEVIAIRQAYGLGATQSSLALKYKVTTGHIGRIVRGEGWQQSEAYPNPLFSKGPGTP